ncbi:replication initiation protein [Endozoicomonas sp. SM1973]|uniref:Replication initiation protein n=1 Tax=Spartinivicinus marinus TaxID=2994442 RepID=A0A853IB49_9GAMM|nr:replication initiation protein [Spartinivicinus marinus]NYZ67848.1 replication initiation protein [Spartinivicinus marinus]
MGKSIAKSDSNVVDWVVKRNELVEAHYKLTAAAQKIIAALIGKVDPRMKLEDGKKLPTFTLPTVELAKLVGVSKQYLYKELKKITKEIQSVTFTILEIDDIKDGEPSYENINMFHSTKYNKTKQQVEFIFHDDIQPYIINLYGNFTQYQRNQIQSLTSSHSIRIYEILRKQFGTINNNKLNHKYVEIELDELKKMLGIEKKYKGRFSNFKTKVLDLAQKELLEQTDIQFEYEAIRVGKPIGKIGFTISHNMKNVDPNLKLKNRKQASISVEQIQDCLNWKEVLELLMPPNLYKTYVKSVEEGFYSDGLISANIDYLVEKMTFGDVEKPGPYLHMAIKDDYAGYKNKISSQLDRDWWDESIEEMYGFERSE